MKKLILISVVLVSIVAAGMLLGSRLPTDCPQVEVFWEGTLYRCHAVNGKVALVTNSTGQIFTTTYHQEWWPEKVRIQPCPAKELRFASESGDILVECNDAAVFVISYDERMLSYGEVIPIRTPYDQRWQRFCGKVTALANSMNPAVAFYFKAEEVWYASSQREGIYAVGVPDEVEQSQKNQIYGLRIDDPYAMYLRDSDLMIAIEGYGNKPLNFFYCDEPRDG